MTRDYPVERLKKQIRSEVPIGSTREQVEAWARHRLGRAPSYEGPYPAQDKRTTLAEAAGVPWDDIGSSMVVVVPHLGWYTVNGQTSENHLWAFFTLDGGGRVKDYHFLTLEELAVIERNRPPGPPVESAGDAR